MYRVVLLGRGYPRYITEDAVSYTCHRPWCDACKLKTPGLFTHKQALDVMSYWEKHSCECELREVPEEEWNKC